MANSNDPFGQARLKHEWANHHINQFHAAWQRFLKTNFCELIMEENSDGCFVRAVSKGEIPAEIPLTIGDAVHNLKCALDHTISELLGWRNTRLTFPMEETREKLVATFSAEGAEPCPQCGKGGKKGRNALIEIAVPGIGEFIADKICPYEEAGGFLWPLNRLDNRDKHRLLIPVVVPQTIRNVFITDDRDNTIEIGEMPIGPGGVIHLAAYTGRPDVKLQCKAEPTAEIFFNEPGAVEGEAVLPTLVNMAQAVSKTIDRIEEFALSVGWTPAAAST